MYSKFRQEEDRMTLEVLMHKGIFQAKRLAVWSVRCMTS